MTGGSDWLVSHADRPDETEPVPGMSGMQVSGFRLRPDLMVRAGRLLAAGLGWEPIPLNINPEQPSASRSNGDRGDVAPE
jgi:hypothetical protein